MGRNSTGLILYQMEILDFKSPLIKRSSDAVIPNNAGLYLCFKCDWEGKREVWDGGEPRCPVCGNNIVPKGKIKVSDTLPIALRRTIMGKFKDSERAKNWGSRQGTVISCEKVDVSPYYENIEHLNLKQEPIELEIERKEFVLTKELEIERPIKKTE